MLEDNKPKPPTNYRRNRAVTERNLLIGFFIVVFAAGLGLIGFFYGGGAIIGGLSCALLIVALVGVVVLAVAGLGKLSEWMDSRDQ
ncbi:MAG: hypothetical protein FJ030_04665 [Chloroflexi bacterium]|nr:hypothetical protein [Chloroflexota bacterium]